MTSVTSYGFATLAGNFTLTLSSTIRIPTTISWVEEWNTTIEDQTPPNLRANFWSSQVISDASNRAISWRHNFKCYCEVTSTGTPFRSNLDWFAMFANLKTYTATKYVLSIQDGTSGNDRIYFGWADLTDFSMSEPSSFGHHRAGVIELEFITTSIPSLVA